MGKYYFHFLEEKLVIQNFELGISLRTNDYRPSINDF